MPLTWFDLLLGAAIIVLLTIFATRIMDFGPDAQVPRFPQQQAPSLPG